MIGARCILSDAWQWWRSVFLSHSDFSITLVSSSLKSTYQISGRDIGSEDCNHQTLQVRRNGIVFMSLYSRLGLEHEYSWVCSGRCSDYNSRSHCREVEKEKYSNMWPPTSGPVWTSYSSLLCSDILWLEPLLPGRVGGSGMPTNVVSVCSRRDHVESNAQVMPTRTLNFWNLHLKF